MNKRIISLILIFTLLLGILPAYASNDISQITAVNFNRRALDGSQSLNIEAYNLNTKSLPQTDKTFDYTVELSDYSEVNNDGETSLSSLTAGGAVDSEYRMDYINGKDSFALQNQTGKTNFSGDKTGEEYIDPMTGNLIVTETDLVLPGVDGLDLRLERYYCLAEAELYNKTTGIESGFKTVEMSEGEYIVIETVTNTETWTSNTYEYPCANKDEALNRIQEIQSRDTCKGLYMYDAYYEECAGGEIVYIDYYYTSEITSTSYQIARSNLGAGWSWGFPSVQIIKDNYEDPTEQPKGLYFHSGQGSVMEVEYNDDNGYYFTNYVGGDITFDGFFGFNTNICDTSRIDYIVTDAENTTYYFGMYGELRTIEDRYGNRIKFDYTYKTDYYGIAKWPLLSAITDTVGRTVTFTYTKDYTYTYTNVTVTSPSESEESLTMTYKKEMLVVENNGQLLSIEPILTSYTNSENETTLYYPALNEEEKAVVPVRFTFADKNFDTIYLNETGGFKQNFVYLLGKTVRPHSRTDYYYDTCVRNLGHSGITDAYRIVVREDYELTVNENNIITNRYTKNFAEYEYYTDYTGYPYYCSIESIPESENYSVADTTIRKWSDGSEPSYVEMNFFYKIDGAMLTKKSRYEYNSSVGEPLVINTNVLYFSNKRPGLTEIIYNNLNNYSYTSYQYNEYVVSENKAHGKPTLITEETDYDTYDGLNREKHAVKYVYDYDKGYLIRKYWYQNENSGYGEFYEYNSDDRLISVTQADGTTISYSYEYNSDGKVSKKTTTTQNGVNTTTVEEVYTSDTAYAFPSAVTKKVTAGKTITIDTTTYTYNMLLGVVASETDTDGNTTYYEYDKLGRPVRIVYPKYSAYSVNAQNTEVLPVQKIVYATDLRTNESLTAGNEVLKCQMISNTTTYYNADNLTSENPSDEELQNCSEYYTGEEINYYLGTGELIENRISDTVNNEKEYISTHYAYDTYANTKTVTDPAGNKTVTYYDELGREIKIVDIFDNQHITEYNRSSDGVGFKALSYFVAANNSTAKENVVEYTYDRLQRITSEKAYLNYPNSFVETKYTYDLAGNVTGVTDANGNLNEDGYTVSYAYDPLNRVTETKNANNEVIHNDYDNYGNIKRQTISDGKGNQSILYQRGYDGEGKILTDTDNSNNSNTYTYNNMGQLVRSVDKDGKSYSAQYNENQVNDYICYSKTASDYTEEKYCIFTPFTPSEIIRTDETESVTEYTKRELSPTGKILSESSEYTYDTGIANVYFEPSSSYKYDVYGNITSAEFTTAEQKLTTEYTYNKNRISQVSVGGTVNAQYEFYADGKLKAVTYPALTDGSVLKTEYEYDGLSRLKKLTNTKGTEILTQYEYTYDNNGNILTTNEVVGESQNNITYTYDKLNRISTVSGTKGADSYYEYDYRGNRKTNFEELDFLSEENAEFRYDEQNKLYYASVGNDITNIEYSSNGYRYVKQINNEEPVFYIYDISGRLVAEAKADTEGVVPVSHYVWGPDKVIAKIDKTTNQINYYLYNGHGDVVQIVDTTGNIVNQYDYDVWGNFLNKDEEISNPFTYFGQTYDETTGLYYLRARYYDPTTGRFTRQDPAEDGYNWYVYGNQNPVMFVDQLGYWVIAIAWSSQAQYIAGISYGKGVAIDSNYNAADITNLGIGIGTPDVSASVNISVFPGLNSVEELQASGMDCGLDIGGSIGSVSGSVSLSETGIEGVSVDILGKSFNKNSAKASVSAYVTRTEVGLNNYDTSSILLYLNSVLSDDMKNYLNREIFQDYVFIPGSIANNMVDYMIDFEKSNFAAMYYKDGGYIE